ncbi:MAG: outer membrane beta-barrel protein [Rhodospirillaceae bacterium]|jgi:opacity protein-like surface antigen|nr:outer membrane beta-barrel protein [Rhodospirillaceae bacterium]
MKLNLNLLSIGLLIGMASVARADGLYVGAEVGAMVPIKKSTFKTTANTTFENTDTEASGSYSIAAKRGFVTIANIGYDLDFSDYGSMRTELEFGYRHSPYDRAKTIDFSLPDVKDIALPVMSDYRQKQYRAFNGEVMAKVLPVPQELLQAQIRAAIEGGLTPLALPDFVKAPDTVVKSILNGAHAGDIKALKVPTVALSSSLSKFATLPAVGTPSYEALAKQRTAADNFLKAYNIATAPGAPFAKNLQGARIALLGAVIAGYTPEQMNILANPETVKSAEYKDPEVLRKLIQSQIVSAHTISEVPGISELPNKGNIMKLMRFSPDEFDMAIIIMGTSPKATNEQKESVRKIFESLSEKFKKSDLSNTEQFCTIQDFFIDNGLYESTISTQEVLNDTLACIVAGYNDLEIKALVSGAGDKDSTSVSELIKKRSTMEQVESEAKPEELESSEAAYRTEEHKLSEEIDKSSGGLNVVSGMFNILYDIPTGSAVRPFFGAGIGMVHISDKMNTNILGNHSITKNSMAYQAIVGVSVSITPKMRILFDYRYLRTTDKVLSGFLSMNNKAVRNALKIPDSVKFTEEKLSANKHYDSQVTMIGLSYSFGANKNKSYFWE